jgi:CBS domain-containing protein
MGPTEAPCVSKDSSVATAVACMREQSQSCVLVVENDTLCGIFTERDFLTRVVAERRQLETTLMVEVMTADPETLRTSDCITYAINKMALGGYRNIPLIGDEGKPVAVLNVPTVVQHLNEVFSESDTCIDFEDSDWRDIGGG